MAIVNGSEASEMVRGTNEDDTIKAYGGNDLVIGYSGDDVIYGGDGDDTIYGDGGPSFNRNDGNDVIDGGAGNDVIYADAGDDVLYGGEGTDTLLGWKGNDVLLNSTGNDTLSGQAGDDIYRISSNLGDVSVNNYSLDDGYDVIEFEPGVNPSDITASRSDDDLLLTNNVTGDVVTVTWHFRPHFGSSNIDEVRFSDGTSWDASTIDLIVEGAIAGTAGDDVLNGRSGDTTYVINLGDGNDIINEYGSVEGPGNTDKIVFGKGIHPDEVSFVRDGVDLVVTIEASGQTVTVPRHFENRFFDGFDRGRLWQVEAFEFNDGTRIDMNNIVYTNSVATEGDDTLSLNHSGQLINGLGGNDSIIGGNGNDEIYGGSGDDTIYGGKGNDILITNHGSDTVHGGSGDDMYIISSTVGDHDVLTDRSGSDTYFYQAGSGDVSIVETFFEGGRTEDTLIFDEGIDPSDISVSTDGVNLMLAVEATGSVITIVDAYGTATRDENKIESILFQDGTQWDQETMRSMAAGATEGSDEIVADASHSFARGRAVSGLGGNDTMYGNDASNHFHGGDGNDIIDGLGGNDSLSGNAGDDVIVGGDGNDHITGDAGNDVVFAGAGNDALHGGEGSDGLEGGEGDDTLNGGQGNDHLFGGEGNDTYVFDTGFGYDTLLNGASVSGGYDVARFNSVSFEDLWFSRSGDNLEIIEAGTDNSVLVADWYAPDVAQLDQIEAGGGAVLLNNQVDQLVSAMAAYDAPVGVGNVIPGDVSDALQPVFAETWQAA